MINNQQNGKILAIDPGPENSAWIICNSDASKIYDFEIYENEDMLKYLQCRCEDIDILAIEMIASYGMPVGKSVFDTCVWIGRFIQSGNGNHALIYRKDIKMCLCGSVRAKDGNIRQAILDRYGGKTAAIGKKASPGPLYGIRADIWSALAVAITYVEILAAQRQKV